MNLNWKAWNKGIKDGLPIAIGYMTVSFSFGILAKQAGLNPFEAIIMSATNLTSAGQFAGLTMMVGAASLIEVALAQLIINSRYFLMSFALSQKIAPCTPLSQRMIMAYGITDEIFGVSMAAPGKLNPYYTFGIMSIAVPGWALGTLFGVISGNILPPRLVSALSIALYGMLIAVIIPPAKGDKKILGLIVLSMFLSFIFTVMPVLKFISGGVKIIILTILIAGIAAFLFPVKENEE